MDCGILILLRILYFRYMFDNGIIYNKFDAYVVYRADGAASEQAGEEGRRRIGVVGRW